MCMLTCHVRAQNRKVKIVAILVVHENTAYTATCNQDGVTYSHRLHGKRKNKEDSKPHSRLKRNAEQRISVAAMYILLSAEVS